MFISENRNLITHLLLGVIIGLCTASLSYFEISNAYYYALFLIFGIMFLLANFHSKNSLQTFITSFLCAAISAIPIYFWQSTDPSDYPTASVFIIILTVYAINAFHTAYYSNDKWLNYDGLFYAVWDTFVELFIGAVFTFSGWLLTYLCAALLSLLNINIDFIINSPWFTYVFTCTTFSIGLYIALSSKNVVRNIRQLILVLCKFLLPILAAISLLFLITWIITLQTLTQMSGTTQTVFLTISCLSIIFFNGVYQDGKSEAYYHIYLQWLVSIFLISTPIFSTLSCYYFITTSNLQHATHIVSFVNYALLIIYNIAYAVIALIPHKPWMHPIKKVNILLAFVLITAAFVTNNSWFMSLSTKAGFKPAIKKTSEQQYEAFQKKVTHTGFAWHVSKKHKISNNAIIIGFNEKPIYLCKNNQNHFIGYINKLQQCVTLINKNIIKTNNYSILTGDKKQLSWINNGFNAIFFYSGYYKNHLFKICRTIHDNKIAIGFGNSYGCKIISNNKVFDKTVFYQYLFLLYK